MESALQTVLAALARHQSDSTDNDDQSKSPSIPCLYSLYYEQLRGGSEKTAFAEASGKGNHESLVFCFPPPPVDLIVQDSPLGAVQDAWKRVMGSEADEATYMVFEDREGDAADDIEND